jgi:hypothetical protein
MQRIRAQFLDALYIFQFSMQINGLSHSVIIMA